MPIERLKVDGVSLETKWVGAPAGVAPTIVLLHEGLGSVAQWGDFPDRLAQATGCGVFLYSRAGYGGSDPVAVPRPLTYMHDEALEVLPEVLDAVGFQQGILLGHSDGASIATIYAGGREDHRILGLILIAPHFFVEAISVASIAEAKVAYESGTLREKLARYHGDNVDAAMPFGAGIARGSTRNSHAGTYATTSATSACRSSSCKGPMISTAPWRRSKPPRMRHTAQSMWRSSTAHGMPRMWNRPRRPCLRSRSLSRRS